MSNSELGSIKKNYFQIVGGFAILLGLATLFFWISALIFEYLRSVPKEIAAPLITGAVTVIVATFTVMVGRHYERKKELDALYREKKTEIYDEFLERFFKLFFGKEEGKSTDEVSEDLVPFLREFTRKLILWSGPEVIEAFLKWKDHLSQGRPDAQSLFLTEAFLVAIRNDLRHSGKGLKRGFFARIVLKNGNLFLEMASKNPHVTMDDLAEMEKMLEIRQA